MDDRRLRAAADQWELAARQRSLAPGSSGLTPGNRHPSEAGERAPPRDSRQHGLRDVTPRRGASEKL